MALTLLMVHGLLAVVLIGAISHQAMSFWKPSPADAPRNLLARFRGVRAVAFTRSIAILYVITVIGGAVVYPFYVLDAKRPLLAMGLEPAVGVFEIKEHFAILGLALLPAYVHYWRHPGGDPDLRVRRTLTLLLAVFVWWNFVVGHIVTAIRGVF
jgi:hypothetical protein